MKQKTPLIFVQSNGFGRLFSKVSKHGWANDICTVSRAFTKEVFDAYDCGVDWPQYGPIIVYGTKEFLAACNKTYYLQPFIYDDAEELSMTNLAYKLKERCLNRIGGGFTVSSVTHFFIGMRDDDEFFIRPNHSNKAFEAKPYNKATWAKTVEANDLRDNLDCWLAEVRHGIKNEWRYWIVDGKISSSSQYRKDGELVAISTGLLLPEVDLFVSNAVKDLNSKLPCYVMDVCEFGGSFKVVELNCINSSGFYGDENISNILNDWMGCLKARYSQSISLERIREIRAMIDEINKLDIVTVQITKDDQDVLLTSTERKDLHFTGLSTFGMLEQVVECFKFNDEVVAEPTAICPSCESHNLQEEILVDNFQYGLDEDKIELSASIPVIGCKDCGEKFTDYRAEEIKDLMIRNIRPK